jgi:hypothetical protein
MNKIILFFLLSFTHLSAQEEVTVDSDSFTLHGTLISPAEASTAILIISGSGPTDRDGNVATMNYYNNSLKMVAEALSDEGYATLRYDKRGVGKSVKEGMKPEDIRFMQFVEDVETWIAYLNEKYDDVIVMGHSLGGLMGMMAVEGKKVEKFISLAGITDSAYNTLKRQLASQPPMIKDAAYPILDSLNQGIMVDSVPFFLMSLFNPVLQDYIISWMPYDPQEEIADLDIPCLIIVGDNDIQIPVDESELVYSNAKNGKLIVVEGMNHVLKKAPEDKMENLATYSNPDLPLHEELIPFIIGFLQN